MEWRVEDLWPNNWERNGVYPETTDSKRDVRHPSMPVAEAPPFHYDSFGMTKVVP